MREIKFRAWDKQHKDMYYWFDGEYHNRPSVFRLKKECVTKDMDIIFALDSDVFKLMQFLRIKDSKGREIYEGDLIKIKTKEVEWLVEATGFHCFYDSFNDLEKKPEDYGFGYTEDHIEKWGVVIGNIYENPELIK